MPREETKNVRDWQAFYDRINEAVEADRIDSDRGFALMDLIEEETEGLEQLDPVTIELNDNYWPAYDAATNGWTLA